MTCHQAPVPWWAIDLTVLLALGFAAAILGFIVFLVFVIGQRE